MVELVYLISRELIDYEFESRQSHQDKYKRLRVSYKGIISACQAEEAGSLPATRSNNGSLQQQNSFRIINDWSRCKS
jgi:uncharacterized protein YbcC (UPF0753/DUF2309 family)